MTVEGHARDVHAGRFDAAEIRAIVEKLVAEVGLPADLDVRLEVDESDAVGSRHGRVDRPVGDHRRERRARGPQAARQLDATRAARTCSDG